jgi:hypothetical protein
MMNESATMNGLFGPCPRCGGNTSGGSTSYFNTEHVCPDCIDRERAHPAFAQAQAAEEAAVRAGDFNFPGVGCPADLYLAAGRA